MWLTLPSHRTRVSLNSATESKVWVRPLLISQLVNRSDFASAFQWLSYLGERELSNFLQQLREPFKYYFADFVRKGGTPPPFTDKIRKVVFDTLPNITLQNQWNFY